MSTAIQWTDETWNPVVGCTKVSQGCKNCYAKTLHDRRHKAALAGKKIHPQYLEPFETVQLMPDRLEAPLHWRKPRRVFVNSVSDLFHEDVPEKFLARVFAVMAVARQHTFQVLTKRPERMHELLLNVHFAVEICKAIREVQHSPDLSGLEFPLANVWLGVSVENQEAANERIPLLLGTPSAVRFLSCEPLLGPIDLGKVGHGPWYSPLEGWTLDESGLAAQSPCGMIDWVIVGGESGTNARPCDVQWIRSIVEQCAAASASCFVKQFGKWIAGPHTGFCVDRWLCADGSIFVPPILGEFAFARPDGAIAFSLGDGKGGNPARWPQELRVREFPREVASV